MSEYCGDYEPVAAWEERTIRARAEHRCSACKRTVRPGELYVRDAVLQDGRWQVVKRCGACEATYRHLRLLCSRLDGFDEMAPLPDLSCGKSYQSEWGPLPDEIAALAFMTNEEASALLAPRERKA